MFLSQRPWVLSGLVTVFSALAINSITTEVQAMQSGPAPSGPKDGYSSTDRLTVSDLAKFRPGCPMREILGEIGWVGNFEMAAKVRGKTLTAISFFAGETLWAIFEDDLFVKFVAPRPDDTPFPIPIGSFRPLEVIADRPPVDVDAFTKEFQKNLSPERQGSKPGPNEASPIIRRLAGAIEQVERQNALLRDQFNAARLRMGMTRAEVAATFKAGPLEAGALAQETFAIYGSTQDNSLTQPLQYKNVLALYRDDRLIGLYSGLYVPGTRNGLDSLRKPVSASRMPQKFTGLPPAPPDDPGQ